MFIVTWKIGKIPHRAFATDAEATSYIDRKGKAFEDQFFVQYCPPIGTED